MNEIYIKCKAEDLLAQLEFDISLRKTSTEGDIMLNTTDIDPLEGDIESKVKLINGEVLDAISAQKELSKKIWNNG
jgi:hypothetical protein